MSLNITEYGNSIPWERKKNVMWTSLKSKFPEEGTLLQPFQNVRSSDNNNYLAAAALLCKLATGET